VHETRKSIGRRIQRKSMPSSMKQHSNAQKRGSKRRLVLNIDIEAWLLPQSHRRDPISFQHIASQQSAGSQSLSDQEMRKQRPHQCSCCCSCQCFLFPDSWKSEAGEAGALTIRRVFVGDEREAFKQKGDTRKKVQGREIPSCMHVADRKDTDNSWRGGRRAGP
jgi:hypothetical protein